MSEAIRLGAMLGPKSDGLFYDNGATCAQGAALTAVGVPLLTVLDVLTADFMMRVHWPWVYETAVSCPACHARGTVREVIPHLNNSGPSWLTDDDSCDHDWSRERIADWVATVEPVEAVEMADVVEAVLA